MFADRALAGMPHALIAFPWPCPLLHVKFFSIAIENFTQICRQKWQQQQLDSNAGIKPRSFAVISKLQILPSLAPQREIFPHVVKG